MMHIHVEWMVCVLVTLLPRPVLMEAGADPTVGLLSAVTKDASLIPFFLEKGANPRL